MSRNGSGKDGAGSPAQPPPASKLLLRREIDEQDELDKQWADLFKAVTDLLSGLNEKDINNVLQDKVRCLQRCRRV